MTPGTRRRAWDAANAGNRAIRDELAAAALAATAPQLEAGEILDAGCGTGWWLARLIAAGVAPERLHGVDLAPERVRAARERAPAAAVEEADVRVLPYEDARFTAVFLLTVLSSVTGAERAFAEAWRVAAPGGAVVVWEPRVPNPFNSSTRLVRPAGLTAIAGVAPEQRPLTLLPGLARRLGPRTRTWYPRLAAGALRTHRLAVWRRPGVY